MRTDGRKTRGAATRAQILAATRAMLPELGVELTLDGVAERVGMTKQAILHHFPSKERLFVELALAFVAAERDAAIGAIAGRRGGEAVVAFLRGLVAFYEADVHGFRLLYLRGQLVPNTLRWFPPEERRERLYPVTGAMYDAVEAAARDGGVGGDARAVVVAAHCAAVGFATMYGMTVAGGDPMKRSFDDYLDAFVASWRR